MPSGDFEISMEWENLEEFVELFERFEDRFVVILREEMTKYGALVEEGAKALSPKAESDLEDSINFGQAVVMGDMVIVEGGANTVYALRRHEEPYRSGTHDKYDDGAKFPDYYEDGRGAITRSKGSWRGQPAGRKYLTNAVRLTADDWNDMLERVLERCIRENLL